MNSQEAIAAVRREFPYEWQCERRIEYLKARITDMICQVWRLDDDMEKSILRCNATEIAWLSEQKTGALKTIAKIHDEIYFTRQALRGKKKDEITPAMIERAREYPFDRLVEFDRSGFTACPWHEEKTPSLHKHRTANIVYCFGCHESADPIKWIMQRDGISFPNAVKALQ